MGRSYGFRVFRVKMYENQKKDNNPVAVHAGSDGYSALLDLIDHAVTQGTKFLPAVQPKDPEEPRLSNISITVASPTMITDCIAHFEVTTGEVGGHRQAVSKDGTRQSLEGASAERGYYVTVLFPRTGSESCECLFVMEVHKGSDVKTRLFTLLTTLSRELRREELKSETEARKALTAVGKKSGPPKTHKKYLFDVQQFADSDHLYRLLSAANSATATFTETVQSSSGGPRGKVQKKLSYSLLTEEQKRAAASICQRWMRRGSSDDSQDAPHVDSITELATAIDLDASEVNDYDEACISIRTKAGQSITVRPFDVREMFTYPVSDGRPSIEYYYEKVAPKATELSQNVKIDTDTIVASEVVECLSDSTSARSYVA